MKLLEFFRNEAFTKFRRLLPISFITYKQLCCGCIASYKITYILDFAAWIASPREFPPESHHQFTNLESEWNHSTI